MEVFDSTDVPFTRSANGVLMDATPALRTFATEMAGKPVIIDGVEYMVNAEQPLAMMQSPTAGRRLRTMGLNVYDPATGEWKVWLPYDVSDHTGGYNERGDSRTVTEDSGFYDIYTGDKYGNLNEVFKSIYM